MEDERIWAMEEKLWHGGDEVYETLVDENVVMSLPAEPLIPLFEGAQYASTAETENFAEGEGAA